MIKKLPNELFNDSHHYDDNGTGFDFYSASLSLGELTDSLYDAMIKINHMHVKERVHSINNRLLAKRVFLRTMLHSTILP